MDENVVVGGCCLTPVLRGMPDWARCSTGVAGIVGVKLAGLALTRQFAVPDLASESWPRPE